MKKVIDAELAKALDAYSIREGMTSLVLMERAALAVAEVCRENCKNHKAKVLAVCGTGNNGADGLAALRILAEEGIFCRAVIVGKEEKATEEFLLQKKLMIKSGVEINVTSDFSEYDIIIDALFGIGLSKPVTGIYQQAMEEINRSEAFVLSVDIPSGVHASTGKVMGCAVKASATVSFGFPKRGHLLFPGKEYCGKLLIRKIGFLENMPELQNTDVYLDEDYRDEIPVRKQRSNKGDYGKTLIIAGSEDTTGAAFMSAMAAYRAGAGIVTVLTHKSIDPYLKSVLPEAIVRCYTDEDVEDMVLENVKKATAIVLGPGISVSDTSKKLVKAVLSNAGVPVIIDADALNIIAENEEILQKQVPGQVRIITPHVGEMSRLAKKSVAEIAADIYGTAAEYANEKKVICVLKDAVSVAASPAGERYISTAGNPGMAKAGSGDVLTGILAAMLAGKQENETSIFHRICLGVHLHGVAGDLAREKAGENSMLARDIIDAVPLVF